MRRQINLYNPELEARRPRLSARISAAMILTVAAVLLATAGGARYYGARLAERTHRLEASLSRAQERLDRAARQNGASVKSDRLPPEIDHARKALSVRKRIWEVVQQRAHAGREGFSLYLAGLARQAVPGVWITGLSVRSAGETGGADFLEITGQALRPELVPDFLQHLKRDPAFQGKSFDAVQIRASAGDTRADDPASRAGTSDGKHAAERNSPPGTVAFELRTSAAEKKP